MNCKAGRSWYTAHNSFLYLAPRPSYTGVRPGRRLQAKHTSGFEFVNRKFLTGQSPSPNPLAPSKHTDRPSNPAEAQGHSHHEVQTVPKQQTTSGANGATAKQLFQSAINALDLFVPSEYASVDEDVMDTLDSDMSAGESGNAAATYSKANYGVLRLDQQGKVRRLYVKRRDLLREHGLQPRDLRRIDPSVDFTKTSPSITIKENVVVLNLGGIRAIVTADKALLFEPSSACTRKFLDIVVPRLQSAAGARIMAGLQRGGPGAGPGSSSGSSVDYVDRYYGRDGGRDKFGGRDNAPPFELEVLEGALMVATGRMHSEVTTVTRRVSQLLTKLPRDITPVNLEELRRIKSALVELEVQADTLRKLLEEVMDDEDELRELNLSSRPRREERRRQRERDRLERELESARKIKEEIAERRMSADGNLVVMDSLALTPPPSPSSAPPHPPSHVSPALPPYRAPGDLAGWAGGLSEDHRHALGHALDQGHDDGHGPGPSHTLTQGHSNGHGPSASIQGHGLSHGLSHTSTQGHNNGHGHGRALTHNHGHAHPPSHGHTHNHSHGHGHTQGHSHGHHLSHSLNHAHHSPASAPMHALPQPPHSAIPSPSPMPTLWTPDQPGGSAEALEAARGAGGEGLAQAAVRGLTSLAAPAAAAAAATVLTRERSDSGERERELQEEAAGEYQEAAEALEEMVEAEEEERELEEAEDLLEYYLQRATGAQSEAERLLEGARDLEESISVSLSARRYEVNRLELTLSIGSFSAAVGAMLAGIFGMNMRSTLEMSVGAFWGCAAAIVALCTVLFIAVLRYTQRKRIL